MNIFDPQIMTIVLGILGEGKYIEMVERCFDEDLRL